MNVALIIAIEQYADPALPARPFAESDAQHLALVLEQHGFSAEDRLVLVGSQATRTILESKVRRALKSLDAGDRLLVFYSGHVFVLHGQAYLTCHDTQANDWEHTSLTLTWLLKLLRDGDCQQVVTLLDVSAHSLIQAFPNDILEAWSAEHLEDIAQAVESGVCLTACAANENTHASTKLKSGIWTHHLVAAFAGQATTALTPRGLLTSRSLHDYLLTAVPRTLAMNYGGQQTQTPQLYAASDKPVMLAELAPLLAQQAAPDISAVQIRSLSLVVQTQQPVKRMTGFKNTHSVPDQATAWARQFVAKMAAEEIEQDLSAVHAELKKAFRFKRADVQVSSAEDGGGTIITPHFNYSITVALDAANPTQVVWRRSVDAIRQPERLTSPAFESVFGKSFDTIEFTTTGPIDLEAFIDRIEERADEQFTLKYPGDLTSCELRIAGLSATIQITPRLIAILHGRTAPPRELLQSFLDLQASLSGPGDLDLLRITGK